MTSPAVRRREQLAERQVVDGRDNVRDVSQRFELRFQTRDEFVEELRIRRLFLSRLLEQSLQTSFHSFEPKRVQRCLQPFDCGHRTPPAARLSYAASDRASTTGTDSRR